MRIAIYNGNLKPPHFISLLAKRMSKEEHSVFLFGTSNGFLNYNKEGLSYLVTDSNKFHFLFLHLITTGISLLLFRPKVFVDFFKTLSRSDNNLRFKLKQFLIWSNLILKRIDVLHIQWASHIVLFEGFLEKKTVQSSG